MRERRSDWKVELEIDKNAIESLLCRLCGVLGYVNNPSKWFSIKESNWIQTTPPGKAKKS